MNKAERWVRILWIAAVAWTLTAFAFPAVSSTIFFILMMLVFTLPLAMLLSFFPTLAVYLTAGAPIYLILRNRSRLVALVSASAVVALPAFVIPIVANRNLETQVAHIGQHNDGGPIALPSGQSLAYLYDFGEGFQWDSGCEETCQRLLFSGVADSVLLGDTSALKSNTGLKRYWIASSRDQCPVARLTKAYADEREVGRKAPYPRPLLADYLRKPDNDNKCLFEASARLDEADVVLAYWLPSVPESKTVLGDRLDPRLTVTGEVSRSAAYVRQKGRLQPVMRRTYASANLLRVPLILDAPFVFNDYTPGGWARTGVTHAGTQAEFGLQAFLTNDLTVRGLP